MSIFYIKNIENKYFIFNQKNNKNIKKLLKNKKFNNFIWIWFDQKNNLNFKSNNKFKIFCQSNKFKNTKNKIYKKFFNNQK